MKNEVEVVTTERSSIALPKERIERLDKHVEARTCSSGSHVMEVLILEAIKRKRRIRL